jgi:hypothetical protein
MYWHPPTNPNPHMIGAPRMPADPQTLWMKAKNKTTARQGWMERLACRCRTHWACAHRIFSGPESFNSSRACSALQGYFNKYWSATVVPGEARTCVRMSHDAD